MAAGSVFLEDRSPMRSINASWQPTPGDRLACFLSPLARGVCVRPKPGIKIASETPEHACPVLARQGDGVPDVVRRPQYAA